MPQKKTTLLEAANFANENGYLYAVYQKKEDGNFHKIEEAIWESPVDDTTEIMVKTTGACTDFKEFESVDGQFCFRLHNNFNTPEVIPVLTKGERERLDADKKRAGII